MKTGRVYPGAMVWFSICLNLPAESSEYQPPLSVKLKPSPVAISASVSAVFVPDTSSWTVMLFDVDDTLMIVIERICLVVDAAGDESMVVVPIEEIEPNVRPGVAVVAV